MFLKKICCFLFLSIICLIEAAYPQCPYIRFQHGKIRYSNRGRRVRFSCFRPYVLIGNSKLECKDDEWNGPLPVCASRNCEALPKLLNGKITYFNDRAIVKAQCDTNFTLLGPPNMHCGADGWNETSILECRANSIRQFETCDFETEDTKQCQWTFKSGLFNWTIMSSSPTDNIHMPNDSFPAHDHTLTLNSTGHFLYLETLFTPAKKWLDVMNTKNAHAKYISPLFPPIDENEPHCLIFYLYANGSHAGIVEVWVNEDSIWKSNGSLGTEWNKIRIPLRDLSTQFRITIEGKGELGQYTNTAIDDLKIAIGEECQEVHRTVGEAVNVIQTTHAETTYDPVTSTIQNDLETERASESQDHQSTITISPNESTKTTDTTSSTAINQSHLTGNSSTAAANHNETNNMNNDIIEESNTFSKFEANTQTTQSTTSNEIIITENNFIYHPAENKDNDVVVEDIPANFTYDHENNELYVNTSVTNASSNKSSIDQKTQDDENRAFNNDMDQLENYFPQELNEPTNTSVGNTTYRTLALNYTVIKSNDTKYKYDHQEENSRNEIDEKENDRRHVENMENALQKNNNQNNEIKNYSPYLNKSNDLIGDKMLWIVMLLAVIGVMSLFVVQVYKRCNFRNKEKDESSILFIKDGGNTRSPQKKDDVLVLNCISQKMTKMT